MYKNKMNEIRKLKNFSKEEVANKLGIPIDKYEKYENGEEFPNLEFVQNFEEIFGISFHDLMKDPNTGKERFFTDTEINYMLDHAHSFDEHPLDGHDRRIIGEYLQDHMKRQREKLYEFQNIFDDRIKEIRKIYRNYLKNKNFYFDKNQPIGTKIFEFRRALDGYEDNKFLSITISPEWVTTPEFCNPLDENKADMIAQIQFENYYMDKNIPLPDDKWKVNPKLTFNYAHYEYHFDNNKTTNASSKFISYEEALGDFADYCIELKDLQ